mmetsp:Transcript_17591/g.30580  ORF Transcript_17591/g.30580 Transcript_17591/m.30580 type:complete len:208 (-) Transcript_17591:471-1094(-)
MMLVLEIISGLVFLAYSKTFNVCLYLALRSLTNGVRRSTVSILCAYTSSPEFSTALVCSRFPWKSGASISINSPGANLRRFFTVSARCPDPPSGMSSRSTDVSTTYLSPHCAIAFATLYGSFGSNGGGCFAVLILQNLHPRVHVSPMSIIVAVPPPQHSPILGHLASSHTVWSFRPLKSFFRRSKSDTLVWSPAGLTLSHVGFCGFW